jgi:hypothetical protein
MVCTNAPLSATYERASVTVVALGFGWRLAVLLISTHSPAMAVPSPACDLFAPRQAHHGKPEHDTVRVCAGQLVEGATGACPSKCPSTNVQLVG